MNTITVVTMPSTRLTSTQWRMLPIAAPPAVRLTLPEANPTYSITAALAITFPFNIAFGIPIYFEMAKWVGAQ